MTSPKKVSILCRYGGNFIEESDKVFYKGGTNHMILLEAQEINYPNLLSKLLEVCKLTRLDSIKYKHPELGLDCLILIKNDEDLCNMMQAFEALNNCLIHLFIFEAQQTLPIHNTIPRKLILGGDKEIVKATENRQGSKEMPLLPNSNIDINAETAFVSTVGLLFGVENELGMDNHNLPTNNRNEYGCANDINENCPRKIGTLRLSKQPTFKIKSFKGKHARNLDKNWKLTSYPAARKWVADIVERRNYSQFAPKVISDMIKEEYGIDVGYVKAWRGRELARERSTCIQKSGQGNASNYNIDQLCEDIKRTNPESRVKLLNDNNHMKFFISYEAAIIPVFRIACKPVVRLTTKKFEGKRPYVWFVAAALDTDKRCLLLACGFIELDLHLHLQDGYQWFCSELFHILGQISDLVFAVDYTDDGGVLEVVKAIFPDSRHRYDQGSFEREMRNKFDTLELDLLYDAMATLKQSVFQERMNEIHKQCPEAWQLLTNIKPEYWATSHFEGAFNGRPLFYPLWIEAWMEGRIRHHKIDVSIVELVEHLHNVMMETFTERAEIISSWRTILVPRFEARFLDPLSNVKIVDPATPARFAVSSSGSHDSEEVDIHLRNCSCGAWQIFGHPCRHAEHVIEALELNRYEYWDERYKAVAYGTAYSQAIIHPLPKTPQNERNA